MRKFEMDYETKCRKCGKLEKWRISKDDNKTDFENWRYLIDWFNSHLAMPSINHCKLCHSSTVQDYVCVAERPDE